MVLEYLAHTNATALNVFDGVGKFPPTFPIIGVVRFILLLLWVGLIAEIFPARMHGDVVSHYGMSR